jgi:hypothetical protein
MRFSYQSPVCPPEQGSWGLLKIERARRQNPAPDFSPAESRYQTVIPIKFPGLAAAMRFAFRPPHFIVWFIMAATRRRVWFHIGLGAAACAALLPAFVALFHLVPPAVLAPAALAVELAVPHQTAHHHDAIAEPVVLGHAEGDCHPADKPQDDHSRHARPHCALCLWLKTFHVLPPPEVAELWQPTAQAYVFSSRATHARVHTVYIAAQPRAPPVSPAA